MGTVRENLLYGKANATEDEMWEALTLAKADQVIKSLEGGLETYVGAGSVLNLSGG